MLCFLERVYSQLYVGLSVCSDFALEFLSDAGLTAAVRIDPNGAEQGTLSAVNTTRSKCAWETGIFAPFVAVLSEATHRIGQPA